METPPALVESLIITYGNRGGAEPMPPCQVQATIALATNSSAVESVPFDVLVDLHPPTPATLVMKGDFTGREIVVIFPQWLCF